MKALLLAGGRGTRLRPLTHSNNKHAIPIANKPLIMYPFQNIVDAGIEEIGIVVNETRHEIETILGDGSRWGVKITYIFQDHPGGLAHALSLAKDFMKDEKFVMVLGDNMLEKGFKDSFTKFLRSGLNGMVLGVKYPREELKRLGCAVTKNGLLKKYVEKPENPPDNCYGVPGFYFFDKNVFKCFKGKDKIRPSARGELEIVSPYNWLLDHGYKVGFEEVKGWWKDPGKPYDTLITNQVVMNTIMTNENNGKVKNTQIEGKVHIEKGAIVKNSTLRGPVAIGKNTKIECCYIGPYTSIYHDCEFINVEIENSIVMENVKVRNTKTRLDSCLIGKDAEVTEVSGHPRSTSLFIGDNSIVKL
mgnify:CR=1 FL=1